MVGKITGRFTKLFFKDFRKMRKVIESYNEIMDSVKGISFNDWSDKQKTSVNVIVTSYDKELRRLLERSKLISEFYVEISAKNHLSSIDFNQEDKIGKELFIFSIKIS